MFFMENMVKYMIYLAKQMKQGIICEGMETQEHVDFLIKCGCHTEQERASKTAINGILCEVCSEKCNVWQVDGWKKMD